MYIIFFSLGYIEGASLDMLTESQNKMFEDQKCLVMLEKFRFLVLNEDV